MRVLVLGTLCVVNLYFGLLGGANQMRGLWLQAFFTAYISTMFVAGSFAPTMRSARLRSLLITSGAGAACALTPMGWPFAPMTTMHFGIIATFVSLVSTMHIRTRAKLESKRDEAMAATRVIRAFEGTARPWIIALTAGATAEEREASRLAGADEHLTKPIRLDELRQAFGRVSVQCG